VLGAALSGVQAAALPAVVSEVPGLDAAVNDAIDTQATTAGLPLSPVAAAVTPPTAGPTPTASLTPAAGDGLTAALVTAWRVSTRRPSCVPCSPRSSRRLAATRLGVTYYERTQTRVAVVGPAAVATPAVDRLDVFGYRARRASARSLAPGVLPIVYYRKGDRRLALALAGDLGLRTSQVVQSAGGPVGLTLVVGR